MRGARGGAEAEQPGGVEAENFHLILLWQPVVEADRIGLGHVERVIAAETQLVRAVGTTGELNRLFDDLLQPALAHGVATSTLSCVRTPHLAPRAQQRLGEDA